MIPVHWILQLKHHKVRTSPSLVSIHQLSAWNLHQLSHERFEDSNLSCAMRFKLLSKVPVARRKNYPSLGQKYTIESLAEQVQRGKCSFASFCNQGEKGKDTRMIFQWFCGMERWQIQTLLIAAGDTAALRISLSRKIIVKNPLFQFSFGAEEKPQKSGLLGF